MSGKGLLLLLLFFYQTVIFFSFLKIAVTSFFRSFGIPGYPSEP